MVVAICVMKAGVLGNVVNNKLRTTNEIRNAASEVAACYPNNNQELIRHFGGRPELITDRLQMLYEHQSSLFHNSKSSLHDCGE